MFTKHIHISDYNYPLPDERIARFPLSRRDESKLLVYRNGEIGQDTFKHLPHYLPKGSLMVMNNTRVIQARLHFRKETGALIEVFLMEPAEPVDYELMFQTRRQCAWRCMVGNLKKWKEGTLRRTIAVGGRDITLSATLCRDGITASGQHVETVTAGGTNYWVDFAWAPADGADDGLEAVSWAELLEAVGELPIPPYLGRDTEESDKTTYQTVYSKIKGSVAAPTAGLHFTPEVLQALDEAGIQRDEVTLHVGAGTFKPVKSEEIEGHQMHAEYIVVHRHTLSALLAHDCQATCVGTTSVRTLESLYYMGCQLIAHPELGDADDDLHVAQWEPYDCGRDGHLVHGITPRQAIEALMAHLDRHHIDTIHGATQIIIAPGYDFKIVRRLITNFHQPQSTLLLLVSAFLHQGHEGEGQEWKKVYRYALEHDFRFLSYGDSSLLMRDEPEA